MVQNKYIYIHKHCTYCDLTHPPPCPQEKRLGGGGGGGGGGGSGDVRCGSMLHEVQAVVSSSVG